MNTADRLAREADRKLQCCFKNNIHVSRQFVEYIKQIYQNLSQDGNLREHKSMENILLILIMHDR